MPKQRQGRLKGLPLRHARRSVYGIKHSAQLRSNAVKIKNNTRPSKTIHPCGAGRSQKILNLQKNLGTGLHRCDKCSINDLRILTFKCSRSEARFVWSSKSRVRRKAPIKIYPYFKYSELPTPYSKLPGFFESRPQVLTAALLACGVKLKPDRYSALDRVKKDDNNYSI